MKEYITHPYILAPNHKITINLVGVGGTGSQVLSGLARIHRGLNALGHTGIHVRVYDDDTVTEANIGRQLFSPADMGVNKAVSSVSRINRFFGYNWEAYPQRFTANKKKTGNITISCVDTAKGRSEIYQQIQAVAKNPFSNEPFMNQYYWLDLGNSRYTGQVVLGTVYQFGIQQLKNNDYKGWALLPSVAELFDLTKIKEEDQGPSCSLAEAIGRQDLFINSTLANLGCNLLWKLFTAGKISYHGLYLNLETMQVRPIAVPQPVIKSKKTK